MIDTAVLDIETTALEADKGIILCAVIKSSKRKAPIIIRTDETNPKWDEGKRGNDKKTVQMIVKALEGHDVLAAHNGNGFDIPFIRTRLLRWGLPRLPDYKLIDPLRIAFNKLRLRSNSLGNISDHLGIKAKKTPLYLSLWMDCILNGTKSSFDKIVEHCIADVEVLEGVMDIVKPYIKLLDDRGSGL